MKRSLYLLLASSLCWTLVASHDELSTDKADSGQWVQGSLPFCPLQSSLRTGRNAELSNRALGKQNNLAAGFALAAAYEPAYIRYVSADKSFSRSAESLLSLAIKLQV